MRMLEARFEPFTLQHLTSNIHYCTSSSSLSSRAISARWASLSIVLIVLRDLMDIRVPFPLGRTASITIVRPKSEGNGCTYDLAERYRLMQPICRTRHDRLLCPALHIKA